MSEVECVCWFCDSEVGRKRRDGLPLLFAAAMPYDKMVEALCDRHRAGMEYLFARRRELRRGEVVSAAEGGPKPVTP